MTRRTTTLQLRAIDQAVAGGKHRVTIAADGTVVILPLFDHPEQAADAALDAEIRECMADGDARH